MWSDNTRRLRHLVAVAALVFVAACGFEPVYKQETISLPDNILASVKAPDNLPGRELVRAITLAAPLKTDGLVRIAIKLSEKQDGQIFDTSGKAERYVIEHRANVSFFDQQNNLLTVRDFKYVDSFARSDNEAINLGTRDRLRSRAMRAFSQSILRVLPGLVPKSQAQ